MPALNPRDAFLITTAPGFEGLADDILTYGGSEPVVWTPSAGEPVTLRAIVREKAQSIGRAYGGGDTWHPVTVIKLSAAEVAALLPGDLFEVRGRSFRVSQGGIRPDGVAMVHVELKEVR